MSSQCIRFVRVLALLCSSSCASEELAADVVRVRASPLEAECAQAPADMLGDFLTIFSSTDPLDPALPQAYGSDQCSGFIFEFDNPDTEELRGAWIQAGGESSGSSGVLASNQCAGRRLEAEYWGYKKKEKEWSKLTTSSATASFEPAADPGTGYCRLEGLIEHASTFEKLRIVARVTQGADTYPMYACLW
jgi:hypothetical protein